MAVLLMVALIVIGPNDLPAFPDHRHGPARRGIARRVPSARWTTWRAPRTLQDVKPEIDKLSRADVRHRLEETIDPPGEFRRCLNAPVGAGLRDEDMAEP